MDVINWFLKSLLDVSFSRCVFFVNSLPHPFEITGSIGPMFGRRIVDNIRLYMALERAIQGYVGPLQAI